jgi:hypothetical protein
LVLQGRSAGDTFTFTAGPAEQATLDGKTYAIDPSAVSAVLFQGQGGSATLSAAGTGNVATLSLGGGTLQGAGYAVTVSGVTTLRVNAASAGDSASFQDGTGSATYYGTPAYSLLTNGTQGSVAVGFAWAAATSTAGHDAAYLYGAAGQYFVGTPTYSLLHAATTLVPNEVIGFASVTAVAAAGNSDTAYLFSYTGSNSFTATPTKSVLVTGGVVNEADGYKSVVANSSSGQDRASFTDTAGKNSYVGTPSYSYLVNGATGAVQEALGFAFVFASAPRGGNDTATLLDPTPAGGLTFLGTPSYSLLSAGGTILNEVVGFPSVTAQVTGGGSDFATLHDAPGVASVFAGTPTDASLSGAGYALHVLGFAQVAAYATAGNGDAARLSDGPAGGTFVGQADLALLYGAGYRLTLYAFGGVVAVGAGGPNHLFVGVLGYVFSTVGTWL